MEEHFPSFMISELDNSDKPREKALNYGISYLTNAELIAIILGSGVKGLSVLGLSQNLLKENDNRLSKLSRLSINELISKHKGIGAAKAISLAAAFELGTRCVHALALEEESPLLTSSQKIYDYMRQKMERLSHEEFRVLYLNQSLRLIAEERIGLGGITSTAVDPRIVLKQAIDKLAPCIVLLHNHPSGTLKPSIQDDKLTQKIKEGAQYLDIRLIDHLIISYNGYYSYTDEGRI